MDIPSECVPVECINIPKVLFREKKYENLSVDAKMLYALLLDRKTVAALNGWIDSCGEIYVIYPKSEMKKHLKASRYRVDQALDELENCDQMVIATQINPGLPCQIYVKDITGDEIMEEKMMIKMKKSCAGKFPTIPENLNRRNRGRMDDFPETLFCLLAGGKNMKASPKGVEEEIARLEMPVPQEEYYQLTPQSRKALLMTHKGYLTEYGHPDEDKIMDDAFRFGCSLAVEVNENLHWERQYVAECTDYMNQLYMDKKFKQLEAFLEGMSLLLGVEDEHIANMRCCMGYPEAAFLRYVIYSFSSSMGDYLKEE